MVPKTDPSTQTNPSPPPDCFAVEFSVRDYELDMFGVVNHANYLHYLEHTRHAFIRSLGMDLAVMQQQGYNWMVTQLEIDYKHPLLSGDSFVVKLAVSSVSRVRFTFLQDIYKTEGILVAKAKIVGTALLPTGRPGLPADLRQTLLDHVTSG